MKENNAGETELRSGILGMGRGGADGKEADEKLISELVFPTTSQHLLLLRREDGCSAGRPLGAQAVCLNLPAGSYGSMNREAASAWQLRKSFIEIKKFVCLEELLEAFEAAPRSSDLTFPILGCRGRSLI